VIALLKARLAGVTLSLKVAVCPAVTVLLEAVGGNPALRPRSPGGFA